MSRRWWFFKDGCQGNKRHLGFSFLQPLIEPKDSFPDTVLFQIIRINDMAVLPLPFEVTTESGRRMSAAVKQAFAASDQPLNYAWVSSISNGYFGYTTTPEEYRRQNYEGGHTLYGQYSTPYLTARLAELAQDINDKGAFQELLPQWRYQLKTNHFLPPASVSQGRRQWLQQASLQLAQEDNEEDYYRVRWQDVGADKIDWHQPLVRIEIQQQGQWYPLQVDGVPVNDDGYDLEVRYLDERDQGMGEYESRWYNPLPQGTYRFVIEARHGQARLISEPFGSAQQISARRS